MCGIVGIFGNGVGTDARRKEVLKMSQKIRHRGPDWSGIFCCNNAIMSHERLSIIDPQSGGQPLKNAKGTVILTVNGEIYNHKQIRAEFEGAYPFQTGSDCEPIIPLYEKYGADFLDKLSGIFAFALFDTARNFFMIARDPIGVIPLYIGTDNDGNTYFCSELKGLEGTCTSIIPFPPGHVLTSETEEPVRWWARPWRQYDAVKEATTDIGVLRQALEDAVKRQLMSDVPYGVLLSGGLDSSVISAIAAKFAPNRVEEDGKQPAWWPRLHSFAVGLKGAPDLAAAQKVADHIGTVHHEIHYTVQEGIDALRDVIYHIDTYDVTTVRASTRMYLLARVIKSMGIKMVL